MAILRSQRLISLFLGGLFCVLSPILAVNFAMSANPTPSLHLQQSLWRSHHLADYQFTLLVRCFCPPPANQSLRVTVKQGKIVKITDVSTGRDLPLNVKPEVKTIDQLFAIVDRAIQQKVEKLEVTYHPKLGYPTRIDIDPLLMLADDEIAYFASDLKPL